jgi:hypothetical protein
MAAADRPGHFLAAQKMLAKQPGRFGKKTPSGLLPHACSGMDAMMLGG